MLPIDAALDLGGLWLQGPGGPVHRDDLSRPDLRVALVAAVHESGIGPQRQKSMSAHMSAIGVRADSLCSALASGEGRLYEAGLIVEHPNAVLTR